jgi:hypothetical protein
MIDVKHSNCLDSNCKKQPAYNFIGLKQLYCSEHKLENMINVNSKTCIYSTCNKIPCFNYENTIIGIYCSEHKLENMINVKSNKCIEDGCNLQPNYNYIDNPKLLYCYNHKKDNMVYIHFKYCIYEGCNISASFNFPDESKRLYCSKHKLDGMICISSKKCAFNNCEKNPTFNFSNLKNVLYCNEHKLENMINIKDNKCKANYCLGTRANTKYKGYCSSCYQQLFPNDPLTLQNRSKTKEIAVRDYINLNFEGFQHDTPLWTGNCDCIHRRRIDHRKLIGNTLLCIETDENQHKGYDKTNEEIRYDDLYMLHGGKFIFIRFNPDKFKNKLGKNLNPMLYTRLPILKEEIESQVKRIENDENTELLEIIKLYYDE